MQKHTAQIFLLHKPTNDMPIKIQYEKMAIGIYNNKEEVIHQISDLSDIYKLADAFKTSVSGYLENNLEQIYAAGDSMGESNT